MTKDHSHTNEMALGNKMEEGQSSFVHSNYSAQLEIDKCTKG